MISKQGVRLELDDDGLAPGQRNLLGMLLEELDSLKRKIREEQQENAI